VSHRAEQIVDAVASLVTARVQPTGVHVFTHRRLSLDPEQDEMPAISVDYGEDSRADGQTTRMIDSVLSVEVTAVVSEKDEYDCRTRLLALRREIHRAVMADQRLGFGAQGFVVTTSYGGASAPQLAASGRTIDGEIVTTWLVHYRMELTDPGND
jgi:hypothetical protein